MQIEIDSAVAIIALLAFLVIGIIILVAQWRGIQKEKNDDKDNR